MKKLKAREQKAPETEALPEGSATAEFSAAELARMRRRKKIRKTIRKIIVWLLILGILGFAAYLWVQKTRAEYRTEYDPYTATVGSISNALSYSGALQLKNSKTYSALSECKVRQLYVQRGDTVKEGDKLIRLSDGTTWTADFDGTIQTVSVAVGDEVSANTNLIKLVDFDHMRVNVRISAANIREVQEGTDCRVTVSTAGISVQSQIGEIDFSTYSGNNTVYYTATVDVDLTGQTGVYPGMQATVTVTQEEATDVVILKTDAISTTSDNTAFVYKQQEDGTMAASTVTLGVSNGSYVEIKEGVENGETVYVVVEKDEAATGWAAILQSTFGSQQVNTPTMPGGFGGGSGGWGGGSGGFGGGEGGTRTPGRNNTTNRGN